MIVVFAAAVAVVERTLLAPVSGPAPSITTTHVLTLAPVLGLTLVRWRTLDTGTEPARALALALDQIPISVPGIALALSWTPAPNHMPAPLVLTLDMQRTPRAAGSAAAAAAAR